MMTEVVMVIEVKVLAEVAIKVVVEVVEQS